MTPEEEAARVRALEAELEKLRAERRQLEEKLAKLRPLVRDTAR